MSLAFLCGIGADRRQPPLNGRRLDNRGVLWAFLNGALFVVYIVLGHVMARQGASDGVQRLGAGMACAFLFVMPIGYVQAARAFDSPLLILAGIGVGVCSSVIPYVCDQLAMSRLPSKLCALAGTPSRHCNCDGSNCAGPIPSGRDLFGIALVMVVVAIHKPATKGSCGRRMLSKDGETKSG